MRVRSADSRIFPPLPYFLDLFWEKLTRQEYYLLFNPSMPPMYICFETQYNMQNS